MLDSFKFHHIGMAVKDIDATAAVYEGGGYRMSDIVFDPIQNVNICWLPRMVSLQWNCWLLLTRPRLYARRWRRMA